MVIVLLDIQRRSPMDKTQLETIRRQYPIGSRIELIRMDDIQAPPVGTRGTVMGVDDIGSVLVSWDTGSRLSLVFGEDLCRRVSND